MIRGLRAGDCSKCGIWHLDMKHYKRWIREYEKSKSAYIQRQLIRWRVIIDKHTSM